jgi:HSP20 family protein
MAKTKNNQETNKGERQGESLARREPASWLSTPTDLMRRFRDEMDRLFQDFGFGELSWPNAETFNLGAWAPQVEMFERDNQLVIRAELPGLKKEDVKVNLTDDALTIEGERKKEEEEKREGYYRSERNYGHFYRRLPLPEGIDADTANASFRDGVLEVTLKAPARAERKGRKLEITDESTTHTKAKAAGR